MAVIDVYATAGTFTDKHQLATDLAATLMAIEGVPDIPTFRQNTAAFVRELPAGDVSNVDGASNYVQVPDQRGCCRPRQADRGGEPVHQHDRRRRSRPGAAPPTAHERDRMNPGDPTPEHTMITDISGVLTNTLLGGSPPADAPSGAAGNELPWTKVLRPDRRGKGPIRYNLESATRRICGPRPRT
jgi:hypothetical protein